MKKKKQNKTDIAKIIKRLSREEFSLKTSTVIKSKKRYARNLKHKKDFNEGE